MTSSSRKRRPRTRMDSPAVERVTTTARTRPDSSTARTGFADRAAAAADTAAYPVVPAWIQWLLDRNPEAGRFVYHLCYPPINAEGEIVGGWTAEQWWTRDRMYWAEKQARTVVRAHRFHRGGVVFAYSPELDDDEAFFAAWDRHQEWEGHWYSREPVSASGW